MFGRARRTDRIAVGIDLIERDEMTVLGKAEGILTDMGCKKGVSICDR